jgi:transforming growth factor-beta-induced protein
LTTRTWYVYPDNLLQSFYFIIIIIIIIALFAPTDAAFLGLPAGALNFFLDASNAGVLQQILEYHVVPGTFLSGDLMDDMTLVSLTQQNLEITNTNTNTNTSLAVNGATIGTADLLASNGVLHLIDRVLIPPGMESEFVPDILEAFIEDDSFSTLLAGLRAVSLVDLLQSDAITVFAPTEEAFSKLTPGTVGYLLRNANLLSRLLRYHIVLNNEIYYTDDLSDGMMISTLLPNADIEIGLVDDDGTGTITLNEVSTIIQPDVPARNGVIHVIDTVLIPPDFPILPPTILEFLRLPHPGFVATLREILEITGIDIMVLAEDGPFTLFAPTDAAFENLPPSTLSDLLDDPELTTLKEILLYHIVPDELIGRDMINEGLGNATTLQGEYLNFSPQGTTFSVIEINDAQLIRSDLFALNGIIMTIDAILVPSTVTLLPGLAGVANENGSFGSLLEAIQTALLGGSTLDAEGPISKLH